MYLVYWGAAEPLGQSLVLPVVTRVASLGTSVTLITFEKPGDVSRPSEMEPIRAILRQHAVRWLPLRYHKRPKWPATLFDVLQGVMTGLLQSARARPHIVHARTFVGGFMGMLLAPLIGAKLVYHAEGSYPDEQVDAGVWAEGSLPHRLARLAERLVYARAHGIVVVSERGKAQIESLRVGRRRRAALVVVPSCVDVERFPTVDRPAWEPGRTLHLVYLGSVGGRYRFERIAEFAAMAFRRLGRISLRVLTPAAPDEVGEILRGSGLPREAWSAAFVNHAEVPVELSRQDVGLHLLAHGIAQHAGSPTKVGEYWASGLPVVITPGIGDTEEIVRREAVGVVLSEFTAEAYERALANLLDLLADPQLPIRCRATAEKYHGLAPGCARVQALYDSLVCARPQGHCTSSAMTIQRSVPEAPRSRTWRSM